MMFALYFDESLQHARASDEAPFTQHGKRWKHSAAIAFSHFGVLYSQGGARVMDSRQTRTLP